MNPIVHMKEVDRLQWRAKILIDIIVEHQRAQRKRGSSISTQRCERSKLITHLESSHNNRATKHTTAIIAVLFDSVKAEYREVSKITRSSVTIACTPSRIIISFPRYHHIHRTSPPVSLQSLQSRAIGTPHLS